MASEVEHVRIHMRLEMTRILTSRPSFYRVHYAVFVKFLTSASVRVPLVSRDTVCARDREVKTPGFLLPILFQLVSFLEFNKFKTCRPYCILPPFLCTKLLLFVIYEKPLSRLRIRGSLTEPEEARLEWHMASFVLSD